MRQQTSLIRPQMLLIQSSGLLILGILLFVRPEIISAFVQSMMVIALLANSFLSIIALIDGRSGKPEKPASEAEEVPHGFKERLGRFKNEFMLFLRKQGRMPIIINIVLSLVLAVLLSIFPEIIADGFGMAFGVWALLTGVVQMTYAIQLRSTATKGFIRYLLFSLVSLLFGLTMVINPISQFINIRIVAGTYMMLFGFSVFIEYLDAMFKWDMENSRFIMHVRVLPPVILTSFLPVWMLDKFNRMLERNNTDHIYEKPTPDGEPVDLSKNNLEILFHLGHNVAMGYGHVDFALGDTVYSYGCYDDASNRAMGFLSDGTFMVTKLKPYLDYCRRWQKKTLVSFTMRLTVDQEKAVRKSLERALEQCTTWHTTEKNSPAIGQSAHASSIIDIKYYKVVSGPFKIYSALKTNCVAMAEILVGQTGVKVLPTRGIITPGSYYAFLDRQLKDPDSPVIRKTVYKINGRQPGADFIG